MAKVMIVDEDKRITEVCTRLLEWYGYEVIPANSVGEAVKKIVSQKMEDLQKLEENPIGVVVVSSYTPLLEGKVERGGDELVKIIKNNHSNNPTETPYIIGTDYYSEDKRAGLDKIVDNKVDFVGNIAKIVGDASSSSKPNPQKQRDTVYILLSYQYP